MWGRRLLLALALLMPLAGAKADTWYKVDTPYLTLFSNERPKKVERLAHDLLKFRFFVGWMTGTDFEARGYIPPQPYIYVFRSGRSFRDLTGSDGMAGYHTTQMDRAILTASPSELTRRAYGSRLEHSVLRHEFVHALLHGYSAISYPRWYDEGLADLLSTVIFEDDKYPSVGRPDPNNVFTLNAERWGSFREVVNANNRYLGKNARSSEIRQQYALGWLFATYSFSSEDLRQKTQTYLLRQSRELEDPNILWREVFGEDLDQTDKKLRSFWRKGKATVRTLSKSIHELGYIEPPMSIEKLDRTGEAAYLGEIHLEWLTKADDVLKHCGKLSEMNTDVGGHAELSALLLRKCSFASNIAEADEWLASLTALEPDSARRYALEADLVTLKAMPDEEKGKGLDLELLKEVRRLSKKAFERNPVSVRALHAHYNTLLMEGRMTEQGLSIAETALSISPDFAHFRHDLIEGLILMDLLDAAILEVDELAYWARGTSDLAVAKSYRNRIAKLMARREQTKAGSSAAQE